MAEVPIALELVLAAISLLEAGKRIYDAANNASDLPEAFAKVAENIPLVKAILKNIERGLQVRLDTVNRQNTPANKRELEAAADSIPKVVNTCRENAEALKTIFEKVMSEDGAPWHQRYKAALRSLKPGRQEKVESLMREILEKLELLRTNDYFSTAVASADLKTAIEQLSLVASSLPDDAANSFASYGTGAINANTGSGKQYNNNQSGANASQTITYQ